MKIKFDLGQIPNSKTLFAIKDISSGLYLSKIVGLDAFNSNTLLFNSISDATKYLNAKASGNSPYAQRYVDLAFWLLRKVYKGQDILEVDISKELFLYAIKSFDLKVVEVFTIVK